MKLNIKTFMDTWDEWHSFVVGWTEAVSPLLWFKDKPDHVKRMISSEWWYYCFGLVMGLFTWLGIARLIKLCF